MRTTEAIAAVRAFARASSKGESEDAVFAKGILATLRWLTDKDSLPPYAELLEDLGDGEGWLSEVQHDFRGDSQQLLSGRDPLDASLQGLPPILTSEETARLQMALAQPDNQVTVSPPSFAGGAGHPLEAGSLERQFSSAPGLAAQIGDDPVIRAVIEEFCHPTPEFRPTDDNLVVVGHGLAKKPALEPMYE